MTQERSDSGARPRPKTEAARRRGPSQESKLLGEPKALVLETYRVLTREDIFPKRSHWLIARKVVDEANLYYHFFKGGNNTKVVTYAEALDRHRDQTQAVKHLKNLDDWMELAQVALSINPDKLTEWARLYNTAYDTTMRWIRADEKRYRIKSYLEDESP